MKQFCDEHAPVTETLMVIFSLSVGAVVASTVYLRIHGFSVLHELGRVI
jgi:hypothetical protein